MVPTTPMPERSSTRGRAAATLGAALLVAAIPTGCRPTRTRVPALCTFDGLSEEERKAQSLDPLTWLTLVSPSVDRQSMKRNGLLTNACGQVMTGAFDDEFSCPGFEPAGTPVESDAIEVSDIVVNGAGEDRMLLWAATDELASGEVEGSAALALWTEDSIEVHAAGVLRGFRVAARMTLHDIGGTPVLVLHSDDCDADGACVPVAQVIPILNRRFVELPVWESERGCIGRAQFVLDKREQRDLGNGVTRRFVLTRSLELTDEGIFVHDLIRMDDTRAGAPDAEPQPFRKVTARRPLLLEGDRLLLEDEDLWERSLRDHGQVESSAPD